MTSPIIEIVQEGDVQVVEVLVAGPAGPAGPGVPVGGTTGQALVKTSNADYATSWSDAASGVTNLAVGARTATTLEVTSSSGADVLLPLADGTDAGLFAPSEKTKLSGIATGAEVNVNADWNAGSGDAQILNKPTLGTAAAAATTDFATAAQGTDSREWTAATVDQAEAEAGSSTTRRAWTAQRVFQSIAAWWAASAAKTKLDGIASGATANSSDATLLNRANHTGTQAVGTISGLGTGVAAALGVNVGSAGAPVLLSGALGTPSSGTLTSCTGLPVSTGIAGLGTGVATFLATPSSANLAAAVTNETGSGLLVFATSPTLTTPLLGTPTSGVLTNCTGYTFTNIASKPTTRSGYGITDAAANGAITASGLTQATARLIGRTTASVGAPEEISVSADLSLSGGVLGVGSSVATLTGTQKLDNKTLQEVKEIVYTIVDGVAFEIDPANGPIQEITLGANRTPAATNFESGQSVKLKIADGTAYAITWTTVGVVWIGQTAGSSGTAPALGATGFTHVELWKEGSTVYGSLIGYSAT